MSCVIQLTRAPLPALTKKSISVPPAPSSACPPSRPHAPACAAAAAKRMKDVTTRRKLVDLAKIQSEEIRFLREQVRAGGTRRKRTGDQPIERASERGNLSRMVGSSMRCRERKERKRCGWGTRMKQGKCTQICRAGGGNTHSLPPIVGRDSPSPHLCLVRAPARARPPRRARQPRYAHTRKRSSIVCFEFHVIVPLIAENEVE